MSKPKKKRRLMTVRELEQKRGRKLKRKPAKPGAWFAYVDDEELWNSGENPIAENRSQEVEHVAAHFEKVYSIPGVAEYSCRLDLKRGRELKDLLRSAGRSKESERMALEVVVELPCGDHVVAWARVKYASRVKNLARLALAVELMGANARGSAGRPRARRGDRLSTAVAEARAEHADTIVVLLKAFGIEAEPSWLLDWFERFFRIGWHEARAKVDKRAKGIADAMERTPAVTDEGKLVFTERRKHLLPRRPRGSAPA